MPSARSIARSSLAPPTPPALPAPGITVTAGTGLSATSSTSSRAPRRPARSRRRPRTRPRTAAGHSARASSGRSTANAANPSGRKPATLTASPTIAIPATLATSPDRYVTRARAAVSESMPGQLAEKQHAQRCDLGLAREHVGDNRLGAGRPAPTVAQDAHERGSRWPDRVLPHHSGPRRECSSAGNVLSAPANCARVCVPMSRSGEAGSALIVPPLASSDVRCCTAGYARRSAHDQRLHVGEVDQAPCDARQEGAPRLLGQTQQLGEQRRVDRVVDAAMSVTAESRSDSSTSSGQRAERPGSASRSAENPREAPCPCVAIRARRAEHREARALRAALRLA